MCNMMMMMMMMMILAAVVVLAAVEGQIWWETRGDSGNKELNGGLVVLV